MISTLILTPIMRRADRKAATRTPVVLAIAPAAALIAALSFMGLVETTKSHLHLIAFGTGAAAMVLLQWLAKRWSAPWIREWSLGISITAALCVTGLAL
jgi:hypothetical protein